MGPLENVFELGAVGALRPGLSRSNSAAVFKATPAAEASSAWVSKPSSTRRAATARPTRSKSSKSFGVWGLTASFASARSSRDDASTCKSTIKVDHTFARLNTGRTHESLKGKRRKSRNRQTPKGQGRALISQRSVAKTLLPGNIQGQETFVRARVALSVIISYNHAY